MPQEDLRDTPYAKELARAVHKLAHGEEARIERLKNKKSDAVEIRLSWWKDGKMAPRPLDLPEEDLVQLLKNGIRKGVLLLLRLPE